QPLAQEGPGTRLGRRPARGEAEAANRNKDQFLAMLGHELRNPLAAIVQAVAVLKDGRAREGHADHLQGIIARQARHLSKLVDDLLEVSRLTSGKIVLSPEPVDLFEIANRCVTAPALANRSVALDGQPVWIEADPIRMEQVINNLLDNAAKYTPEGGRITVSVGKQAGRALLRVRDTGVGIPPDLLSRIFDAFIQGGQTIDRA